MAVSTNFQCNDYERLRELTFLAQIGWWEANFATRTFRCSEYICDLLKLENDEISFDSFSRLNNDGILRNSLRCEDFYVYNYLLPFVQFLIYEAMPP